MCCFAYEQRLTTLMSYLPCKSCESKKLPPVTSMNIGRPMRRKASEACLLAILLSSNLRSLQRYPASKARSYYAII